jgi:transposase
VAQQDLLALHRVRARLFKQRIALSNQIRALVNQRGVVLAKGAAGLRAGVAAALADEHNQELSGTLREVLGELFAELHELELKLKRYELRLERAVKDDQRCVRLMAVPGVGPKTATALVATVGDAREFKSGRELSAFLGLTPRQHSSGGKTVLLGVSKHGDRYLRTLLIHGARVSEISCWEPYNDAFRAGERVWQRTRMKESRTRWWISCWPGETRQAYSRAAG